jgi:hypothetical protein
LYIHKPVGEKPFHFVKNNNTPVLFSLVFLYIKYAHVVYLIVFYLIMLMVQWLVWSTQACSMIVGSTPTQSNQDIKINILRRL